MWVWRGHLWYCEGAKKCSPIMIFQYVCLATKCGASLQTTKCSSPSAASNQTPLLFITVSKSRVRKSFFALHETTTCIQSFHDKHRVFCLRFCSNVLFFSSPCGLVWVLSSVAAPSSEHICSNVVRNYHNKQAGRMGRTAELQPN